MPIDNNVETMTPASGVADALQNILARKRLDARQNMLDQLKSQDTQSEMQARQDNAATNATYREHLNAQRDALAAEEQEKAGRRAQIRQASQDYMSGPDFLKLPTSQQAAFKIAALNPDDQTFRTIISGMMKPDTSDQGADAFVQDRDGNVYDSGTWVPKGAHVGMEPAPQQPAWANQARTETFSVPDDPSNPTGPHHDETHQMIGNQRPDFTPTSKTRITGGLLIGTHAPAQRPPKTSNLPFDKSELDKYGKAVGGAKVTTAGKVAALNAFIATLPDRQLAQALGAITNPDFMKRKAVSLSTLNSKFLTSPQANGGPPIIEGLTPEQSLNLDTILNAIRPPKSQ